MINFIKRVYFKRKLKKAYKKAQVLTKKKFKLRMLSINTSQEFCSVVDKLKELGVLNPKEAVIGKRPLTGEIK